MDIRWETALYQTDPLDLMESQKYEHFIDINDYSDDSTNEYENNTIINISFVTFYNIMRNIIK